MYNYNTVLMQCGNGMPQPGEAVLVLRLGSATPGNFPGEPRSPQLPWSDLQNVLSRWRGGKQTDHTEPVLRCLGHRARMLSTAVSEMGFYVERGPQCTEAHLWDGDEVETELCRFCADDVERWLELVLDTQLTWRAAARCRTYDARLVLQRTSGLPSVEFDPQAWTFPMDSGETDVNCMAAFDSIVRILASTYVSNVLLCVEPPLEPEPSTGEALNI